MARAGQEVGHQETGSRRRSLFQDVCAERGIRGKDGVSAGVLLSFLKRGEPRVVANRHSPLHPPQPLQCSPEPQKTQDHREARTPPFRSFHSDPPGRQGLLLGC